MNFKIFFYCIIFILPEVDLFIFSVRNLFDIQIYNLILKKKKEVLKHRWQQLYKISQKEKSVNYLYN